MPTDRPDATARPAATSSASPTHWREVWVTVAVGIRMVDGWHGFVTAEQAAEIMRRVREVAEGNCEWLV